MSQEYLNSYLFVALFTVLGLAFVSFVLSLSKLLRPSSPDPEKLTPYECGMIPIGEPWAQFNVRYYIFALLFVVFDVETVFMYPWALVFDELGWFAYWEMIIFIVVLGIGLAYAWKKGVLRWV